MSTVLIPDTSALDDAGLVACEGDGRAVAAEVSRGLKRWFGVELTILDADAGDVLYAGNGQPAWDVESRAHVCRTVADRGAAEFIEEVDPLLVMALPCERTSEAPDSAGDWVAVGVFVTHEAPAAELLAAASEALGVPPDTLERWSRGQTAIAAETLERLAKLCMDQQADQRRVVELEDEIGKLSQHLCHTYEEISLIHQLTDNLSLSRQEDELARQALQWLSDIVPAKGLALQRVGGEGQGDAKLIVHGDCPVGNAAFSALVDALGLNPTRRMLVANRSVTSRPSWTEPDIRELIFVPLVEGDNFFGWLAAFNHSEGGEFGSVEANFLSSVSAILGVHRGNTQLYRGQAELLCDMVHALTSAIDAKDPYTRGHSDRVARVAVRLARELGCDKRTVETLYLSGLVHDVGKIGIEDHVLRKPGRLTDEEFEHIKLHPQLGYNILCGIKQLCPVLPVVLHHHEAWDGSGYPHGLTGKDIPYLARIAAVADAFDAMGSDRVYRKGMSDERLDAIIREGAGKQWDAEVVSAFFRAREDIRDISTGQHRDDDAPELVNLFLG